MEAILFALSIEVALLQMRILEGSIQIRSLLWKPNDNWEKLAGERIFIKNVLSQTLVELAESRRWSTLQQTVESIALHSDTLIGQQQQSLELKKAYKHVIHELRTKRRHWSRLLKDADYTIAVLRDKKRDDVINANLRLCYADKWLCAREESLELQLELPRPVLPRTDHENRVHSELMQFIELQIKERQSSIEDWRVKYAKDIAAITQRIVQKQEVYQKVRARREDLQKLYDDHDAEIRSWLSVKRERAERKAEEQRRQQSATRIQAWWRGVMVRLRLGAFKFLKNIKKPSAKAKKKIGINNMEAILFALSIEVALLQMRILEGSIQIRSLLWKPNDNWEKLAGERIFIKNVLSQTLVELAESRRWSTLQQTVESIALHSDTLIGQQQHSLELKKAYKHVIHELRTKRRHWSRLLKDADYTIAVLRDKKRDDVINANLRLCYADKWLCAREESLELQLELPRPVLPRPDHENRVHSELMQFIELQIKERQSSIEDWRVKYAKDIAAITQRIVQKQEVYQKVRARREDLQKLYDDHDAEIRSWLSVKRERAERKAEEQRRQQSATRIQAWWRGVMVRLRLGAFKFLKNIKKPSAKAKKK